MMSSIRNRKVSEKLVELASIKNQVEAVHLQDKLGEQSFHENITKAFEPVTDTTKITSEDLTKTMMLTSEENKKALENLNDKLLEIINDRGILASYSLSPLSKTTNLENKSQIKLVKDPQSKRVNDLL